jgi:SAM-dependent methyltransferase
MSIVRDAAGVCTSPLQGREAALCHAQHGPLDDQVSWGGLAALAVTGPGTRTLAIGLNADAFSNVAAWFGSDATVFEWPPAPDCIGTATAPPPFALPFESDRFDTVFLGHVLDSEPAGCVNDAGTYCSREHLLAECRRVLKPGGMLLALVENRFRISRGRDSRPPVIGLKRRDLMWRRPHRTLPRGAYVPDSSRQPLSQIGWSSLLKQSGFDIERWYTSWPSSEEWKDIIPHERTTLGSFTKYGGSAYKRYIGDGVLRALRLLGFQHAISPNFLIAARNPLGPDRTSYPGSVLEEILAVEGEGVIRPEVISNLNYSESLGFILGDTFLKVALSATALSLLKRYAKIGQMLQPHPISRHIPLPARLREIGGVWYLACPVIKTDPQRRTSEEHMAEILALLSLETKQLVLSETDMWNKLFHSPARIALDAVGGTTLLRRVEKALRNRHVRAGLVHGDLHAGNVLVGPDHPFIIDWDSYEACSPQFLDALDAMKSLLPEPIIGLRHFAPKLGAIVAGDPKLPLRRFVYERDDELSIQEMLACYILWHLSIEIECYGAQAYSANAPYLKEWLARCEELLGTGRTGPYVVSSSGTA